MTLHEINCPSCQWHRIVATADKLRMLQQLGMMRRSEQPTAEMIEELFHRSAGKLVCGECQRTGLRIDIPREDEEEWGGPRLCNECRKPIDPLRIEIFPDTKICVKCQQKDDDGVDDSTPDFCPRCGEIMIASTGSGGGLTSYRLRCPRCRTR